MTTPPEPTVEEVVLLDESGASVGTALKSGVHGRETPLHLAFSCYIFDQSYRLLVTQRALHKPTWGGAWTNSCCGHPAPGEPLADAVRRRVRQELGLELDPGPDGVRLLLPRFRYRAVMDDGTVENEMCPVFVATTASPLRLDSAEVASASWVPWAEFRREVLAGERAISPWCIEQVRALPEDPLSTPAADPADLPPAARPR